MVQFCNAYACEEDVIKLVKMFWLYLWYLVDHTVSWRICGDMCITESCDSEGGYLFTPTALFATSKKEVYIIGNGLLFRYKFYKSRSSIQEGRSYMGHSMWDQHEKLTHVSDFSQTLYMHSTCVCVCVCAHHGRLSEVYLKTTRHTSHHMLNCTWYNVHVHNLPSNA